MDQAGNKWLTDVQPKGKTKSAHVNTHKAVFSKVPKQVPPNQIVSEEWGKLMEIPQVLLLKNIFTRHHSS